MMIQSIGMHGMAPAPRRGLATRQSPIEALPPGGAAAPDGRPVDRRRTRRPGRATASGRRSGAPTPRSAARTATAPRAPGPRRPPPRRRRRPGARRPGCRARSERPRAAESWPSAQSIPAGRRAPARGRGGRIAPGRGGGCAAGDSEPRRRRSRRGAGAGLHGREGADRIAGRQVIVNRCTWAGPRRPRHRCRRRRVSNHDGNREAARAGSAGRDAGHVTASRPTRAARRGGDRIAGRSRKESRRWRT